MKSLTLVVVSALLALASAQSLAGLPACAESCALNGIGGSGCPVTNYTCICESKTFISGFLGCAEKSCNSTDFGQAEQFGVKFCAQAGVTITAPAPTGSATSAPVSTSAPASTAAPATTSAPPPSSTSSAPVSTFTGAANLLGYSWILLGAAGMVALGL